MTIVSESGMYQLIMRSKQAGRGEVPGLGHGHLKATKGVNISPTFAGRN